MSYRKPDPRIARDRVGAEWRKHQEANPDHAGYGVADPFGWLCCGGLDGESCAARSSSLADR